MWTRRKLFHHSPPGTPPGTLVAHEGASASKITAIAYREDAIEAHEIGDLVQIENMRRDWAVVWINVDGLGSIDLIEKLGKILGLHPLALEDVLNQHQRPKVDTYDDHLFIVTEAARCNGDDFEPEQVGIFVGRNFVLTMQEKPQDVYKPVRDRLQAGKLRRARFVHPDYLAYSLIDAMIDGYFPVLDHFSDRLDALEEEVVARPDRRLISDTHMIKRELQQIRHGIWPMRDMLNSFASQTDFVNEETRPYLRDCYDHIIQVVDIVETYRERASGLVDIYLSSLSNRTNEVMRVLTVIATIFMPLSFIASLYGMNFDTASPYNMPELHWRYGYPYALGLMALVAAVMLVWFWRKGWFAAAEKAQEKDFHRGGAEEEREE